MKLTIFTLLAFVAISLAWSDSQRENRRQWNDRKSSLDAEPFKSGKTYKFRYDSQVASGLGSMDDVSSDVQQATHRLSSWVHFNFENDRSASLRLEDIRMAVLNGDLPELRRVQSMQLFEDRPIDSETLEQLRMPCSFDIVDGVIERIYFHQKDPVWSKNIKRAILNMVQLNLKQRNSNVEGLQGDLSEDRSSTSNMFTLPEVQFYFFFDFV